MNFEEWYENSDICFDLTYSDLKAAYTSALDEAIKTVKEYDHPNDFIDANDFADGIAGKIEGLKC